MPFRKLFWVLSALTIVFLILQMMGYDMLEIILSLLLVDLAVVEISRQEEGHNIYTQLKPELVARISNVEKLCSGIISSVAALPTMEHFCHLTEERISEHRARLKEEIKEDMDRLAKKAIDIENRLHEMRKTVAAGIGSIDDRLRAMETGKWTIESADESEEEEKTEQPSSEYMVYGENVVE